MAFKSFTYRFGLTGFLMVLVAFVYVGCSGSGKKSKKADSLVSGKATIIADEAYKPILEDQKFLYQIRYPETDFNMIYTGEDSAYQRLLKDSSAVVVVSTPPTEKQMAYFKEKGFPLNVCPIAYDAIVVVVNKNSPLEKLSHRQLKDLISGKILNWEQLLTGGKMAGPVFLGFNHKGSGIISHLQEKELAAGEKFSPNTGTFKNTLALLDSVKKHDNLVGFIPYNYISDKDDTLSRSIKQNFKIISLQSVRDTAVFVLPSQTSIADSTYPLRRKVLAINHEGKSGLGTGFVIFMASHHGQRAMLKAGLVPATMPGRLIRIIKKNI